MSSRRDDLIGLSAYLKEVRRTIKQSCPDVADKPNSLSGLLKELQAFESPASELRSASIGLLRHVACSGGSVISRAVSLTANLLLLSEVDPFSDILIDPMRQHFSPSDVIKLGRNNVRPISDRTVEEMFVASVEVLLRNLDLEGRSLVVRDHPHSQHFAREADQYPSVHDMLARIAPVRSVVTVRHPMESYLSLEANGWIMFSPSTIDEYARRYHGFLNGAGGAPIFKYEDFVAAPGALLRRIVAALGISAACEEVDLMDVIRVTGDSGRSGNVIARRPPKPAPDSVIDAAAKSSQFRALCERLEYPLERI
jgi:hypothetical protein